MQWLQENFRRLVPPCTSAQDCISLQYYIRDLSKGLGLLLQLFDWPSGKQRAMKISESICSRWRKRMPIEGRFAQVKQRKVFGIPRYFISTQRQEKCDPALHWNVFVVFKTDSVSATLGVYLQPLMSTGISGTGNTRRLSSVHIPKYFTSPIFVLYEYNTSQVLHLSQTSDSLIFHDFPLTKMQNFHDPHYNSAISPKRQFYI